MRVDSNISFRSLCKKFYHGCSVTRLLNCFTIFAQQHKIFANLVLKFCQIQNKPLKIAKDLQIDVKVAKFGQIWSHCKVDLIFITNAVLKMFYSINQGPDLFSKILIPEFPTSGQCDQIGRLIVLCAIFKAFGNNQFPQISHILRQFFVKVLKSFLGNFDIHLVIFFGHTGQRFLQLLRADTNISFKSFCKKLH